MHHLDRVRELLTAAATLPDEALDRELRPGMVLVWFEGDEPSAALMAERLVFTIEVWVAAIAGQAIPEGGGPLLARFERAARAFARIAKRVRDEGAYDDAFVDALCEPPEAFTYGGVLAHVLTYGAIRREALAAVLRELGADVPSHSDPIEWERANSLRIAQVPRGERPITVCTSRPTRRLNSFNPPWARHRPARPSGSPSSPARACGA